MQLVGSEGYTLCRLILEMGDVSMFVWVHVLVLAILKKNCIITSTTSIMWYPQGALCNTSQHIFM